MQNAMQPAVDLIDAFLKKLRSAFSATQFRSMEHHLGLLGGLATPAGILLGFALFVVLAIKMDSFVIFLAGVAWILVGLVAYYVGSKLQTACSLAIHNNPSNIANREYLDVIALVNLITASCGLLGGGYLAIKGNVMLPLWIGLGIALVLYYMAWLALQPQLISTYVQNSSSAGMDAIAILVLTNKMYLRANKVFFSLIPLVGAILLGISVRKAFGAPEEFVSGGMAAAAGWITFLVGLISPLLCYVLFIFSYLTLDVMRSILMLSASTTGTAVAAASVTAATTTDEQVDSAKSVDTTFDPNLLKWALVCLVVCGSIVFGAIKGREYYEEYQLQVAAEKQAVAEKLAAAAQQKALEEAEKERVRLERERVESLSAHARKLLNASSLDFVLSLEVNRELRAVLRTSDNMRAYETFFSNPTPVRQGLDLIYGTGCKDAECSGERAFGGINTRTGAALAAVKTGDNRVLYFGTDEASAPPELKKWVMAIN